MAAAAAVAPRHARAASTLDRPSDPVVLTGADAPSLQGLAPGVIVAFRYEGGWQQIPVQVDERAVKDFGDIYNQAVPVSGVSELVYTDGGTFTGADPDPTLDGDDEIAFMARDAGGLPPVFSEPAGVVADSGLKLTITDPLDPGAVGYVYLFRSSGALDPGAGQQYVSYAFNLLSGPYKTTYGLASGPNPENSLVSTPSYSHHFSDRWISDELRISAGAATAADILDRHKSLFSPGNCVRSEDTFSAGEGAFIVNKGGPVRALRSYIGANSGPLTQREHIFYDRREDVRTFLRVHAIPGVMDFFDYSPAASGMIYYNDLAPAGVAVDGVPDSPATGAIQWEMVSGTQGTLVMSSTLYTNIPAFAYTSYYLDDSTPATTQCTGDAFAYGSSGPWVNQAIPCTDPLLSCTDYLRTTRTMYFDPPGGSPAHAQALHAGATTPLSYSLSPYVSLDSDGDGVADGDDNCPTWPNPGQALPPWAVPAGDDDCDGWTTAEETFITTDANMHCGAGAWPPDLNDTQTVNISDVNEMKPAFFSAPPGPPYSVRLDLQPDSAINISDINRLKPVFFLACGP